MVCCETSMPHNCSPKETLGVASSLSGVSASSSGHTTGAQAPLQRFNSHRHAVANRARHQTLRHGWVNTIFGLGNAMPAMALFTAAELSCVLSDTACAVFLNAFFGDLYCAVVFPQRQSASCICSCLVAQVCCTGFPSFRGQLVQAAIFGVPFAKALANCTNMILQMTVMLGCQWQLNRVLSNFIDAGLQRMQCLYAQTNLFCCSHPPLSTLHSYVTCVAVFMYCLTYSVNYERCTVHGLHGIWSCPNQYMQRTIAWLICYKSDIIRKHVEISTLKQEIQSMHDIHLDTVSQGSGATGWGMAVDAEPAALPCFLEPVTFLCSVPSPLSALLVIACFSDIGSSAAGASVCQARAEDVSLLYALHAQTSFRISPAAMYRCSWVYKTSTVFQNSKFSLYQNSKHGCNPDTNKPRHAGFLGWSSDVKQQ